MSNFLNTKENIIKPVLHYCCTSPIILPTIGIAFYHSPLSFIYTSTKISWMIEGNCYPRRPGIQKALRLIITYFSSLFSCINFNV